MVGTRSEKRRGLGGIIARPKLSILFALLIFLGLVAGAKVTIPLPQATAVIEIRANPLHDQIAALESGLAPGSIAIRREAERLRSVDMALAVLAQLPDEEVAAIGTDNGTRLADRLAALCSRENAVAAMARLLCAFMPAGDPGVSAKVAAIREALEITADAEHGQISIAFRAADPDRAAAMANLFAETYAQQRQPDKQRLRQQFVAWITERLQMSDSSVERAADADAAGVTDDAVGVTVMARDTLRTLQADPTEAARPRPSGGTSSASNVGPLSNSTAWGEPAAVVRSTASPPVRAAVLTDGLVLMLAVPVSLILGVALGKLVDIVWPTRERSSSFYDNPYWPLSGNDALPSRGRTLVNAEPGRKLIATKRSTGSSSSSSAEGGLDTRQEQMLPIDQAGHPAALHPPLVGRSSMGSTQTSAVSGVGRYRIRRQFP